MISEGDFIKIEYVGKDEKGTIFDSTSGEVAKTLHGREGPMLMVFGRDFLISGLAEALKKMKKGDTIELTLPPEKAFGHRNRELLRRFTEKELINSEIAPQPGVRVEMQTDYGRMAGTVKSVNSGRVLIDFNHPLADHTVSYKLTLADVTSDVKDKIAFLLDDLSLKGSVAVEKDKALIRLKKHEKFEELKKQLSLAVPQLVQGINQVEVQEES